jgi:hypothetical protein
LSGLFVALAPKRLIFFIDYRANNGWIKYIECLNTNH